MSHGHRHRHYQLVERPRPPLWKQVVIELCIVGIFLLLIMAMFLRHSGAPSFPTVTHY